MVDLRIMPQVQGVTGYPHKWANILTAPLSEGAVSTYLEALNTCITDKFVPSPMIVQSLLYFTLHPPDISPLTPTPLSILYKIASLHSISSLMNFNTIPSYPREKIDIPNWINYEVNGDIAKSIRKRMKGCEKEGVWDLVWEQPTESEDQEGEGKGRKRRKRARSEESDEDEDGEEGGKRGVSERGWVVLEWLVHIWEKDQEERGDYSPAFLAQLPKSGDMQIDNPTLPLEVLHSVLNTTKMDDTDESGESQDNEISRGIGKEGLRRREQTAGRLMALLINTANPLLPTPKPPFHSSTLPLSLLPFFRLPPGKLENLLRILSTSTPTIREKNNLAHFLVHGIEDSAGVRSSRVNRSSTDFVIDKTTYFPRPTIGYLFELLLLPPNDQGSDDEDEDDEDDEDDEEDEDREEKMGILKLVLVATMLQIAGDDKGWERGRSKSWRKAFVGCSPENGSTGVILRLLDTAKGD